MKTTPSQIRSLLEETGSWPNVFRALLSDMHPENRTYIHLMNELTRSCEIDFHLMNEIQRWNHLFGEAGYTDEQLSEILNGRISPER